MIEEVTFEELMTRIKKAEQEKTKYQKLVYNNSQAVENLKSDAILLALIKSYLINQNHKIKQFEQCKRAAKEAALLFVNKIILG